MLQFNSLRDRLLILFAGISFLLGLCTVFSIGEIASKKMKQASGEALYASAQSISNMLATNLAEREREMVLLSQSPFFAAADFNDPQVQQQLDQVKTSYQYYAWLGIANLSGKVTVAANQLLQGADVSERPWFINGLSHVYLGDVHKAVLLAKILQSNNPSEPMRFIDFATPIYDLKTHKVKGVLAAHADWGWAGQVLKTALSADAQKQGIEVFIVNSHGEILYPFKSIGQVNPPDLQKNRAEYFTDSWHSKQQYLTTDVPVVSKTQMDLGWRVMIRQPINIALADVRTLQKQILLIGFILSAVLLLITYKLADSFSRPIAKLAKKAYAVQQGNDEIQFTTKSSILELQGLSESLGSMTETLLQQKKQLQDANSTLEQKVTERTRELELANTELEKLARYDVLTGLYNRRASNDYAHDLYQQWQRYQQAYTILLMDIDFFKKINDSYGHEVGDKVLQEVAKLIPMALRKTDFVARFGGEEFLVLLPATELDGAVILAERVRELIAHSTILVQQPITMSIGVSEVQAQDVSTDDVIRHADQCLYTAKKQGRNRVVAM
ncbi:diguanylate cyclase [Acinetobacter sp. MD2(2019)]|uniref:sensor domain-containing diguanylate cyclase n=1 Tax=Acinetobacter sp. MD2(2019) TaxID=2605273 RepID=UPI002D1E9CBF|nr:diguanylate cyclase [Acinetobacter sp. MD2(2019)]MEB3755060.1 diguanylate cyclase [Acinetobacter sp. MD2(2019)]